MDFRKPQEIISINGFPISFREVETDDEGLLWVPHSISRNEEASCWRIYAMDEMGLFSEYVHDEGSSLNSLEIAFEKLKNFLESAVSRFTVDERSRAPGRGRDPLIDTGYTGVSISRTCRASKKSIVVICHQMIKDFGGGIRDQGHYVGGISEDDFEDDPVRQERKFFWLITEAVAIRRAYNHIRSLGEYLQYTLSYDEVPNQIKDMKVTLPSLDLGKIMESFEANKEDARPRTTGGDPEKLIRELKDIDFFESRNPVFLRGRLVRFFETEFDGEIIWIPRNLFRSRDSWRIKLPYGDSWLCTSIPDNHYQNDPWEALWHAWSYLVDALGKVDLPSDNNKKSMVCPLLCTGVYGVHIQPGARFSKKKGEKRWSFALCVSQMMSDGKSRIMSIDRWFVEVLSDERIENALLKATAMMNYRNHLIDSGLPLDKCFVTKEQEIEPEFWPSEAVCPIYADDLRFHAELQSDQSV